jgi:hypothetical protein
MPQDVLTCNKAARIVSGTCGSEVAAPLWHRSRKCGAVEGKQQPSHNTVGYKHGSRGLQVLGTVSINTGRDAFNCFAQRATRTAPCDEAVTLFHVNESGARSWRLSSG